MHWPDGDTTKGIEKHIEDLKYMWTFAPDNRIQEHPARFGTADGEWTAVSGWLMELKGVEAAAPEVNLTRRQLIAIIGIHQEVGVPGRKNAKIFWTGRSQAVRLPKEFRFDGDTVSVRREGKAVILEPANDWPEGYVESFTGVPDDLARPAQGKVEKRARIR